MVRLGLALLLAAAPPAGSPKAQLHGSVQLDRYNPVVGAAVLVSRDDGTGGYWLTTTDTRGDFRFDGLDEGIYRCTVRREGLVPVLREGIALRAPYRGLVELTLVRGPAPTAPPAPVPGETPVRVEGIVTQQGGGPAQARVRWVPLGGGADPFETRSGADGRFVLEGARPGAWQVEILGSGMLPLRSVLDVRTDTKVRAFLVIQPANYKPLPEDLIPPEEPVFPQ